MRQDLLSIRPRLFTAAAALLCLVFLASLPARPDADTADPKSVLRLHVLANSDSAADQELKLTVRDRLLASLEDGISRAFSDPLSVSREQLMAYVLAHREDLEREAEACMAAHGVSYGAAVEIGRAWFPDRRLNGTLYPGGEYDAIRVLLGKAEGHNWWCVLYPPLTLPGAIEEAPKTDVPSGHEKDADSAGDSVAGPPRPLLLPAGDENGKPDIRIRLRLLDWIR